MSGNALPLHCFWNWLQQAIMAEIPLSSCSRNCTGDRQYSASYAGSKRTTGEPRVLFLRSCRTNLGTLHLEFTVKISQSLICITSATDFDDRIPTGVHSHDVSYSFRKPRASPCCKSVRDSEVDFPKLTA